MTDAQRNSLKLDFRNEIVKARTSQGSTSFVNLQKHFKTLGLTDDEMSTIVSEVNTTPL
jgi:hypothetical protein